MRVLTEDTAERRFFCKVASDSDEVTHETWLLRGMFFCGAPQRRDG